MQQIIFTKRAFNAIITETIDKNPLETGGIFIGYILDNGIWIVVETIPPGINTKNTQAYFEYDTNFINYVSNVIAKQYKGNLQVLGLWHRHPGSMDTFSPTDDVTNRMFANTNILGLGAITGLINCDPKIRLTMYHVDKLCNYIKIDWSVDDGIIPENLLALKYTTISDLPILSQNGFIAHSITNEIVTNVPSSSSSQTIPIVEEYSENQQNKFSQFLTEIFNNKKDNTNEKQ